MKLRAALLVLAALPLVACAGAARSNAAYELPDGYVARHASPATHARAERVASAELARRGWVSPNDANPRQIVVVPAVRQTALQHAGGIEWDVTSADDHVVVVAVRDPATGEIVHETVLAEADIR